MSVVRGWADETGSRHMSWQGWFTSRAFHPRPGSIETDSTPLSAKSGYPFQCASHKCCVRLRDWCLAVNDEDKMMLNIMGMGWEGKWKRKTLMFDILCHTEIGAKCPLQWLRVHHQSAPVMTGYRHHGAEIQPSFYCEVTLRIYFKAVKKKGKQQLWISTKNSDMETQEMTLLSLLYFSITTETNSAFSLETCVSLKKVQQGGDRPASQCRS